jgi:hypothetical protein
MACSGVIAVFFQLFVGILLKKFDHAWLYRTFLCAYPFAFLGIPILNLIAQNGLDEATGIICPRNKALIWVGIMLVLAIARVGSLAYGFVRPSLLSCTEMNICRSCNLLLIKAHSTPWNLGQANGLAQFSMCVCRSFAPPFIRFAPSMHDFGVLSAHHRY